MKQKLSPQTSSFIVLSVLCLFGGLLVIFVSSQLLKNEAYQKTSSIDENQQYQTSPQGIIPSALAAEGITLPDTSSWLRTTVGDFSLSVKIPPTWKITTGKKLPGFEVMEVDPGKKYINIKIYRSKTNYYVMDELPAVNTNINGHPALNISNMLYGISANGYYYTFDLGRSLSLAPQFNAMVQSADFKN